MRKVKEIRLQRLEAIEALWKCTRLGRKHLMRQLKSNRPGDDVIFDRVFHTAIISDTLSWVLGETEGSTMKGAIFEVDNLSKYFRTGRYPHDWMERKIASTVQDTIQSLKGENKFTQAILRDKKRLLGVDWPGLEFGKDNESQ